MPASVLLAWGDSFSRSLSLSAELGAKCATCYGWRHGDRVFMWLGVNLLAKLLLRLIRIINFVSKLWANTCFSTIDAVVAYALGPALAPAPAPASTPGYNCCYFSVTHTHTHTLAQAYGTVYVLAILCLFIEFMPLSLPALRRQACQSSAPPCSALLRSCHNAGASEPSSVCVQQRISMRSAPAVAMAMDVAVAVATAGAVAVAVRLSLPRNPR